MTREGERLRECLKNSYSYDNRAGWGAENLKTELLGVVREGDCLNYVYEDEKGNYWNKKMYETGRGIVSEYEKIFGRPEPARGARRRR